VILITGIFKLLTPIPFEIRSNWQLSPLTSPQNSFIDPSLTSVELIVCIVVVVDHVPASASAEAVVIYQTTGARFGGTISFRGIRDSCHKDTPRMLWTQHVRLLHLVSSEYLRVQLIELLPQRIHAAIIELSSEAIVAQQLTDILLAQRSSELYKLIIIAHFDADRVNDVEDVVD
jgi:hypothetical protein